MSFKVGAANLLAEVVLLLQPTVFRAYFLNDRLERKGIFIGNAGHKQSLLGGSRLVVSCAIATHLLNPLEPRHYRESLSEAGGRALMNFVTVLIPSAISTIILFCSLLSACAVAHAA